MKKKNSLLPFAISHLSFLTDFPATLKKLLLFFIVSTLLSNHSYAQWTGAEMNMLTNNNFEDASLPEGSDYDEAGNVHLIYLRNEVAGEEQKLIYRRI